VLGDLIGETLNGPKSLERAILEWSVDLSHEGERLRPEPFVRAMAFLSERFLLTLTERRRQQTILFSEPMVRPDSAVYIVLVLLFSDVVCRLGHQYGLPAPTSQAQELLPGDVVLVTQRTAQAERLFRSMKIGGVPITDFWDVVKLTRETPPRGQLPRVQVSNPGWLLTSVSPRFPGAVIVDASHPRTQALLQDVLDRVRAPLLIVVCPPLNARLLTLANEIDALVWLWDSWYKSQIAAACNERDGGTLASDVTRKILLVNHAVEVDRALQAVYRTLCRAMRATRRYAFLAEPWLIYHRLRQLVTPLLELERVRIANYRTMSLGQHLELFRGSVPKDAHLQTAWPDLVDSLTQAYEVMRGLRDPPKFWALATRISDCLNAGNGREPLRVVLATEQEAILLSSLMGDILDGWQTALQDGLVQLVTVGAESRMLAAGDTARTVLMGYRTERTRHLDYCPGWPVEVISYPHEVPVEEAALRRLYRALDELRAPTVRTRVLRTADLPGDTDLVGPPVDSPSIVVSLVAGDPPERLNLVLPDDMEPLDLEDAFADIDWTYDAPLPDDGGARGHAAPPVNYLEVLFSDGTRVRYPEGHRVDVWYENAVARMPAASLRVGHRIVVLVDEVYGGLFDRLVAVLNEHRSPSEIAVLELWRRAKRDLLRRHESIRELHRELRARGLGVDYSAVVAWHREGKDEILAPQAFGDFCILAAAAGIGSDTELVQRLFGCIQNERVLRRRAGHWLNELLRGIASGAGEKVAHRAAKDLGVDLGDFYAVIDIRTIRDIRR